MEPLRIGQAARASGLTTKAIRYYEQIGLVEPPPRTGSGYRQYDSGQVERLRFIRKSRDLGFSLAETRSILYLHAQTTRPCSHVVDLLGRRIEGLDRTIADLEAFREQLATMRDTAETVISSDPHGAAVCSIIEHAESTAPGAGAVTWLDARNLRRSS
ncbi:MAG: heavy metal-responsive transcriptional regulator [Chloroflexi bacterium]|nr:heavy metal-responsive transcriptional regulator [Chloroflexota bacterium]